jgi:CHAD domain-containing protein
VRWLKLRRARRAVILAAKSVESSYIPGLIHEHDPDDLHDLRETVRMLRRLESG